MEEQGLSISKEEVISFLKANFVGDMSTTNGDKPTCSPIVYVVDDELSFYFVTNRDSYKAKNIISNPNVCLSVWRFSEMSVQLDGTAEEVTEEAKKEWVVEAFGEAATQDPNFWAPIFRIKRGDYAVFKIKPTWLRVLDLTHNTVRAKLTPYTQII